MPFEIIKNSTLKTDKETDTLTPSWFLASVFSFLTRDAEKIQDSLGMRLSHSFLVLYILTLSLMTLKKKMPGGFVKKKLF